MGAGYSIGCDHWEDCPGGQYSESACQMGGGDCGGYGGYGIEEVMVVETPSGGPTLDLTQESLAGNVIGLGDGDESESVNASTPDGAAAQAAARAQLPPGGQVSGGAPTAASVARAPAASPLDREQAEIELIQARAAFYKKQTENQEKLGKVLDEIILTFKAVKTSALVRLADDKRRAHYPEEFPPNQGFVSVPSVGHVFDLEGLLKNMNVKE